MDGIYRLSGVTSNIQRLRHAFDEDRVPALHSDEGILQDIHSVASLLKMYFRELPNPLCTYQLYSTFVGAVQANSDAERLRRMRDAVRKLPPPHYRYSIRKKIERQILTRLSKTIKVYFFFLSIDYKKIEP